MEVALIAIACSYDGETSVRVLNKPDGSVIDISGLHHWRVETAHADSVDILTLYANGKTFATGRADKTIEVWNKADIGKPLHILIGHTERITAMDFSVDGKFLASGSSDNTVRLWDVATGQHLHIFTGHSAEIGAVAFLGDKALSGRSPVKAKVIASGSSDGTVFIWDLDKITSNNSLK